jgi:hypothetical protein
LFIVLFVTSRSNSVVNKEQSKKELEHKGETFKHIHNPVDINVRLKSKDLSYKKVSVFSNQNRNELLVQRTFKVSLTKRAQMVKDLRLVKSAIWTFYQLRRRSVF